MPRPWFVACLMPLPTKLGRKPCARTHLLTSPPHLPLWTEGINLPFKAVVLVTEKGRTRLEVSVKLKSSFPSNLFATNVIVLIPMPEQTARANFQLSTGACVC